jgi:malonate transporter and related proteins
MLDIINLALPFFGVIFVGFACGKWRRIPDQGLAWMNFFILYVALPALFFRILSKTPFEQLAQIDFIIATTLATACTFTVAFGIGLVLGRGRVGEATLAGVAGGFGNVGYMGPGLALATLGAEAAVPVALVFCFDALLIFALVPLLMTFSRTGNIRVARVLLHVVGRIALNPLLLAAGLGTVAAAVNFEPPVAVDRLLQFLYTAAAPCALFALGVTVALRPVGRMFPDVPLLVAVKLIVHPIIVVVLLRLLGPFSPTWASTAVLMAALPPALTAYVFARQYGTWIEQASGVVLFGTLAAVITLIIVMWLVKTGSLAQLAVG